MTGQMPRPGPSFTSATDRDQLVTTREPTPRPGLDQPAPGPRI